MSTVDDTYTVIRGQFMIGCDKYVIPSGLYCPYDSPASDSTLKMECDTKKNIHISDDIHDHLFTLIRFSHIPRRTPSRKSSRHRPTHKSTRRNHISA